MTKPTKMPPTKVKVADFLMAPHASSAPAPIKKAPESPIWVLRPVPSSKLAPNISAAAAGCTHQPRPMSNSPKPERAVKARNKFIMF